MKGYFAIVQHDEDVDAYKVEFPDLPGCECEAPTVDDALHAAEREVKRYLETCDENGQETPDPRSSTELYKEVDARGGVAAGCFLPVTKEESGSEAA